MTICMADTITKPAIPSRGTTRAKSVINSVNVSYFNCVVANRKHMPATNQAKMTAADIGPPGRADHVANQDRCKGRREQKSLWSCHSQSRGAASRGCAATSAAFCADLAILPDQVLHRFNHQGLDGFAGYTREALDRIPEFRSGPKRESNEIGVGHDFTARKRKEHTQGGLW